MIRSAMSVSILFLCMLTLAGDASAERWEIASGEERAEVRFLSKATMESFEGVTDQVEGWVAIAGEDSISWLVTVDLASLDTGIGLRNRHMRENHLHTDRFPEALFSGSMAWPTGLPLLERGVAIDLVLSGRFELHGVSRERSIPVTLSLHEEGFVEVEASFDVSLAAYDIPLPKFLMLKLADVQQVRVRLIARSGGGGS